MSQKLELFAVLRTWSALATGVAEIQRADVIFGKVSVLVSLDVLGSTGLDVLGWTDQLGWLCTWLVDGGSLVAARLRAGTPQLL